MTQRTKYFQLRLTSDEYEALKSAAQPYSSVSHYIRSAVKEYSNVDARQRLKLIGELGELYRKFQNELSWAGSNLNQSVKRANELSVAGLLSGSYITEVLMPTIASTQKTVESLKRELEIVTQKATSLK